MTETQNDTATRSAEEPAAIDFRVWLADLTYTQQQISAELIPQAIGGIATYAESVCNFTTPIRLFKYPEALAVALEADGCPEVIGFSNYVWNSSLALAFAARIRKVSPETIIVFGGPHYPVVEAEQEAFLRARPVIDFYIVKEGELAFANLVAALARCGLDVEARKRLDLASVHFIDSVGTPHLSDVVERIRDLTEIPSPYTTGKLDEFFDGKLLPIIQTNRGCPFSCTFCVEGVRYYNKIYRNTGEKVAAEIDYIGRKMVQTRAAGGRNDLFIADSNFGMYRDDVATCQKIALAQDVHGWPEYINVATGKNQKSRVLECARLVRGAIRLSGSVQSLDTDVLRNIQRDNIAADDLMQLALEAADIGANSYSEVILGLPGDTKETHYGTMRTIIDSGFQKVIPYTLMILPGSDMGTDESVRKFGMDLRYRVLPRCFGQYRVCGETIRSAEIEQVCVATNSLSYEAYIECRRLHLMVSIFYNDAVFGGLLKLFRVLGVSVFRWLEILRDTRYEGDLAGLIARFEDDTRNELWAKRETLAQFIQQDGVIERYIDGELGLNLMFTYKSIAMTRHVSELEVLARRAAHELLEEVGQDAGEILDFVDDVLRFDSARMTNLFDETEAPVRRVLRYDIDAFLGSDGQAALSDFRLPGARTVEFLMNDDQRAVLERGLTLFGDDDAGIGRILSKFHIARFLRRPARSARVCPHETTDATLGAEHFAPQINFHDA